MRIYNDDDNASLIILPGRSVDAEIVRIEDTDDPTEIVIRLNGKYYGVILSRHELKIVIDNYLMRVK